MALEKTTKYFRKSEKFTLHERARDDKISAVKIEPGNNNQAIIRIPYNQELIEKIKTISGRKWNPQKKYWEVLYSEDLITKLQNLFGENLTVDPYF